MSELVIPLSFSLVKDKMNFRRKIVYKLCVRGLKQKEIASELNCSLSTIEKDFRALREGSCQEVHKSGGVVCE